MRKLFLSSLIAVTGVPFLLCGNGNSHEYTANKIGKVSNEQESVAEIEATGMIAYMRNSSEIRLIDSNGQGDHRIWTHPDAKEPLGLFEVAWRPDGKELAFSSAHEAVTSLYHADIYSIRPDGSGFRKITNAPGYPEYAKYKKGTVTVTVRNMQYSFDAAESSAGIFQINIVGAEKPQQITLPPGSSKTLVFKNVADFGKKGQGIVASYGPVRWSMPGTDVVAGQNVKAPDFYISGDGIEFFGAFRPVWNYDGTEISYRDGACLVKTIPANNPGGEAYYKSLFGKNYPRGSCIWDMGPTPALANQVLYSENDTDAGSGFYTTKKGGDHNPSGLQTYFSDLRYQQANDVHWLPDGSGFLYSTTYRNRSEGKLYSNIFHFDMRTKKLRQVTTLKDAFTRRFSVSPSGKWIVYEKCRKRPEDDNNFNPDLMLIPDSDIWMIKIDGGNDHLLVKNGQSPSWSK